MVKTLLTLCKAACASGLFVLPNHKLSEVLPRSILHRFNLTFKLGAGIIYMSAEDNSWRKE